MKEYKLSEGNERPYGFRLKPIDEDSHSLCFTNKESAHKFKLALGLGTFPCPKAGPDKWKWFEDVGGIPQYLPTEYLPDEEPPTDCCQSGCQGCPNFRGF